MKHPVYSSFPAGKFVDIVKNFKAKIEAEIFALTEEVVSLLATNILPNTNETENKVFWQKMYALKFSILLF